MSNRVIFRRSNDSKLLLALDVQMVPVVGDIITGLEDENHRMPRYTVGFREFNVLDREWEVWLA